MAEKTEKKKTGKIVLIVIAAILGVILLTCLIIGLLSAASAKGEMKLALSFPEVENEDIILPQKDEDGNWFYETDRELKVLQLTDIHLGGGCFSAKQDAKALNAVASMVTAEKPDLVVITGDLIFAIPFIAGTMNNLRSVKIVAALMEQLGVPWISVFGNHDTEVYDYYNREEVADYLESDELKHCLFRKGPDDIDGYGNSIINVKNSDGIITHSLFFIDSHDYRDEDRLGILWKYDNIHENQIEWYKNSLTEMNEKNKAAFAELSSGKDDEEYRDITSLLFFHIPISEYKDAWESYKNGDDTVKLYYGTVGEKDEALCIPEEEDDLFETMQSLGGKKGIFCGHDHLNNFSMDYKDIRLTYGMSIDYLAYSGISKIGSQRGCTRISLGTDGSFDCEPFNYYQDRYKFLSEGEKEKVTMQEMGN